MKTASETETEKKLVDAVLKMIPDWSGAESVSYIHRELRADGWRGLGTLHAFEQRLRDLGFVVREGRNERGQHRREVTL